VFPHPTDGPYVKQIPHESSPMDRKEQEEVLAFHQPQRHDVDVSSAPCYFELVCDICRLLVHH